MSPGRVAPRATSQEARTASTAILEAAVGDHGATGRSAAVAADGRVVWADSTDVANIKTEAPLESFNPMNTTSASKQSTAMAVLMLAEQVGLTHVFPPQESPTSFICRFEQ